MVETEDLLSLDPENTLCFYTNASTLYTKLKLTNASNGFVAFKVKTTAPKAYLVGPISGTLKPGDSQEVQIILQSSQQAGEGANSPDRFLVQAVAVQDAEIVSREDWAKFPKERLQEQKLNVVVEDGRLEYIQAENYEFRSRCRRAEDLRHLVVWGGCVANCAEDELSRMVDDSSKVIQSVVYCPDRTKGGVLIRPKYYQGDRGGEAVFTQLTDLTIRLSPVLLPPRNGWVMPELRRLRLLCVLRAAWRTGRKDLVALPSPENLRAWLGVRNIRGGALPQQMLQACPKLESITIALGSTLDESMEQVDWVTLLPPKPVPWEVHRLLVLPLLSATRLLTDPAPEQQGARGACFDFDELDALEEPVIAVSPLALLSVPLVNIVLSFLGRRRWEYRWSEIPAEASQRLQLPPEFFSLTPAALMGPVEVPPGIG